MKHFFKIFLVFLIGFASHMDAKPYQDIHISVSLRTNVHNVTKNIWYPTITAALAEASNNNTIEVYRGTYNEAVVISGFTNLVVANMTSPINDVVIDGATFANAVTITNSSHIQFGGFKIKNAVSNGIYLANTTSASLVFNYIASNNDHGIKLGTNSKRVIMASNNIFTNQGCGICMWNANSNTIQDNIISRNAAKMNGPYAGIAILNGNGNRVLNNSRIANNHNTGIGMWGGPQNNYIQANTIISNSIAISIGTTNYRGNIRNNVVTNNIMNRNSVGVMFEAARPNRVVNNIIAYNSQSGVLFRYEASTNVVLENNMIKSNTQTGIDIQVACVGIENRLNTIRGSSSGIRFMAGTMSMEKNNIMSNSQWNMVLYQPVKITNDWFGSTIASSIGSMISNYSGYSNFTPYRLFGRFDITPGADTVRLPSITWMTAISSVSAATLKWLKPASVSGFTRYFVYRSTNGGYTNLSQAQRIWQTNDQNVTNYVDTGVPKAGKYYYCVTSLDDALTYTNEAWYSYQAAAVVGTYSIIATNTNLSYSSLAFNAMSPTNISFVSNIGSLPCQVIGQLNDFTNQSGSYVWDVTNTTGFNRVRVDCMVTTNATPTSWFTVDNQTQNFVLYTTLPIQKKIYLYTRVITPSSSSSLGPYRSRIRVQAIKP
ncbi:MAG: right-handed parallel beta-helix repeat-containing protein [bacterium]|nr:right-handed parallel beta-helix repeat-containing protein [bacterium]